MSLHTTSPIIPLYPYQRRWVEDQSPLKAMVWARSTGKTFIVMLEPVVDVQEAELEGRRVDWFCFSGAADQTAEMIRYAGHHARALKMAAELGEERYEVGDRTITVAKIEFEHGSRILGLPTNPHTIRGKHGNLIWGEAGKTPHAQEMWTAAAPIASRGFKVRIEGTPGERSGPFYEITGDKPATPGIHLGRRGGWRVHWADIHAAIADGAPLSIEKAQALVGRGRGYATEYELLFEDAGSRLLSVELIIPCESPDELLVPELTIDADRRSEWERYLDADKSETRPSEGYDKPAAWRRLLKPLEGHDLYLGFDVGRTKDLSVLWFVEPDGLKRRTRAILSFRGRRFTEQRAALFAAIERSRRCCIDRGLIGEQISEEAEEQFGAGKVERVGLNEAVKEDLATRVLRSFEDGIARIPSSRLVRESLHSVYRQTTAAGKVRLDAKRTDETGHADHFWAYGLALMATSDGGANLNLLQSWGKPAWSREGGLL